MLKKLILSNLIPGPRRLDGLRAVDVMGVLQEQLAILSGGRDRRGGAILTFPSHPEEGKGQARRLQDSPAVSPRCPMVGHYPIGHFIVNDF